MKTNIKAFGLWLAMVVFFTTIGILSHKEVVAQTEQRNIELHKVGSADRVEVYKMIHYGCEIFVAVGSNGNVAGKLTGEYATPVAITTGRGCK